MLSSKIQIHTEKANVQASSLAKSRCESLAQATCSLPQVPPPPSSLLLSNSAAQGEGAQRRMCAFGSTIHFKQAFTSQRDETCIGITTPAGSCRQLRCKVAFDSDTD